MEKQQHHRRTVHAFDTAPYSRDKATAMATLKHQQNNATGTHVIPPAVHNLCSQQFLIDYNGPSFICRKYDCGSQLNMICYLFSLALKKTKTSGMDINHFTDVHGLPCIEKIVSSVEETPEPIITKITGKVPEWINGKFLRNGPGKFEIGSQKWVKHLLVDSSAAATTSRGSLLSPVLSILTRFNHWFDGMALLHQFKISNGQVTYKSRFLSSDSYQANKESNRIAVSEFGTVMMPDPCKNFFQRFLSRFELPSECMNRNQTPLMQQKRSSECQLSYTV